MKYQKVLFKRSCNENSSCVGAVVKQSFGLRQSGSSLIEALVSLLVFSVGALGIAALQTTSLVRTDDTRARSVVIWKAQDLVDRMRTTKTVANPLGQIGAYVTAIDNDNDSDTIGAFDANDEYSCGAQPRACDTQTCNPQQMVDFNLWDVICNTNSGLSPDSALAVQDGSSAVRNLEVALVQNANEYQLYFEWLNRSASNNVDEDGGPDTGLGGGARTVQTNLCGNVVQVDARLDTYCVRFQ